MTADELLDPPPVPRYKLTLILTGNTLDEIERELVSQTRGGFLLDSDYYQRNSWTAYGGRHVSVMEHANPDMTPERYDVELDEWAQRRKLARRENRDT